MNPEYKNMASCDLCGRQHQMGPNVYDGTFIPLYQLEVCNICFKSNWDGWGPSWEAKILAHLKAKGLPVPPLNEAGYLPRGF